METGTKNGIRAEKNREWSREYMRRKRAANPELFRERQRQWRAAHPEKHRESVAKWKREHPDKVREAKRKYAHKHPEKGREKEARRRHRDPEKNRKKVAAWHAAHPEKAKAKARRWRTENKEKAREKDRRWGRIRRQLEKEFRRATNFVSTLNNISKLQEGIKTMITESAPVKLHSNDSVENLITLIGKAGDHLRDAAEMLSRLVANDPQTISKIHEAAPTIPAGLLTNLLRVGERSLHPDLLLNNCVAFRKLRLLPYSTQERVLQSGVIDLVVDVETGDTLRVPVTDLTGPQASQVISREGIRTRDDQRAWLKRQQVSGGSIPKGDTAAYFVKKDRLIITRACELSKAQLLAVVGELVG